MSGVNDVEMGMGMGMVWALRGTLSRRFAS